MQFCSYFWPLKFQKYPEYQIRKACMFPPVYQIKENWKLCNYVINIVLIFSIFFIWRIISLIIWILSTKRISDILISCPTDFRLSLSYHIESPEKSFSPVTFLSYPVRDRTILHEFHLLLRFSFAPSSVAFSDCSDYFSQRVFLSYSSGCL